MANENLTNAKTAKNDEFYTQYHDIEAEMGTYLEYNPDVFRGKTVLMPCDDPESSEADKQFAIIGNLNAITYKEVFPLIKI